MRLRTYFLCLACAVSFCPAARGQTTTQGSSLAMRSTGSGVGSWTIDRNGYVGTYITLASEGNVTVGVNASGTALRGLRRAHPAAMMSEARWFATEEPPCRCRTA